MMNTYRYSAGAINQDNPYKGQGAGTFSWFTSSIAAVDGEADADEYLKSVRDDSQFASKCVYAPMTTIT